MYNAKAVITDVKKDSSGVRKALEMAVLTNPENLSAWDNLLKHHYQQNSNNSGIVTCDKLIAILKKKNNSKTIAEALIYKGDFLWKQDKKEEAKKVYAESLVWDSENKTAKERAKL